MILSHTNISHKKHSLNHELHIDTATNMSLFHFDCSVCLETLDEPRDKVRNVGGDFVCSECALDVIPLFEAALKNEINFPPRWGSTIILFDHFADLFDEDFCLAYRDKIEEYGVPIPERVYCDHMMQASKGGDICGNFIGAMADGHIVRCRECKGWKCMECREAVDPPLSLDTSVELLKYIGPHVCDKAKVDNEVEALDQATKGKEWQECPNSYCRIKCDLRDGCNAITCICGCTFCFICGEETGDDARHWTEGKSCPRWGRRDAKNPMFDAPVNPMPLRPRPGNVLINLRIEEMLVPVEVSEQLHLDADEALTLVEEIDGEQQQVVDNNDDIPKIILDMDELLNDLSENIEWIMINEALNQGPWFFRAMIIDPVSEAVEMTNFLIRDERLRMRMRETHAAALEVTGEESVIFDIPVIEIFERYLNVHKPAYEQSLQRFALVQNGRRAHWARLRDRAQQDGRRASQ